MLVNIGTAYSRFWQGYIPAFVAAHAGLTMRMEHWELDDSDYLAIEHFIRGGVISERVCVALFLAVHAPRGDVYRERGIMILEQMIEDFYLRSDAYSDYLAQGILGFARGNPSVFARLYDFSESWRVVGAALQGVSARAALSAGGC